MTNYDIWLSTNRPQERADMAFESFERSDDFMSAYVDYCDDFVGSAAYDKAFERWANQDDFDEGDYIDPPEDVDGMAYYGLTLDESDGLHLEEFDDDLDPMVGY